MTEDEILSKIDQSIRDIGNLKEKLFTTGLGGTESLVVGQVGELIDQYSELSALSSYTAVHLSLPRDIKDDLASVKALLARYNSYRAQHRAFALKFRIEKSRSGSLVKLDEGDIEQIQSLINETRKIIGQSAFLDAPYKQRLLARLEVLQSEIHKVQSDMDRALAGLIEVGDAAGKFGTKAEPLLDAFERIAKIFNSKKDSPLQLPSPPKLLPSPNGSNDEEE